jgi:glycosyltransferase involved in cell wall biosynthesis
MADAVWLPGDRQSVFARKLGFGQKAILRGSLSCDRPIFETVHLTRIENRQPLPRAFIFAGRFSPEKGVDILAKAYQIYHDNHENPWPLVCCGSGPLQPMLEGRAGIRIEGFIQPDDLPTKFGAAGCLIVPSNWDHWSVVVHEATCAGLLVLASEVVGAVAHLVQPNFNGFIFSRGDAAELAVLMSRVSSSCDVRLNAMSQASFLLSQQFSPTRWADTLLESFAARNS